MDFLHLFTEYKKCLQDLYLYISLKNPSRFLAVTLENVVRAFQALPLNESSFSIPCCRVRMFRVSEEACLSETHCALSSSQCWIAITSGWFYIWKKGLLWSWQNDFWIINHQHKPDHCSLFLRLNSMNEEDSILLFTDGLWLDKGVAELLCLGTTGELPCWGLKRDMK